MADRTPYTPRLREAIILSKCEAERLQHGHIGPEHLLLGIIQEGGCLACQILQESDVDLDLMKDTLELALGTGSTSSDPPRLTNTSFEIWETMSEIAQDMGHRFIGTEHMLLGLTKIDSGAAQCLRGFGLTYETIQQCMSKNNNPSSHSSPQQNDR
jgi:ATP-dependent Clp protease ATP-binding subunit ClpC